MSATDPSKQPADTSTPSTGISSKQKLVAAITAGGVVLLACFFCCPVSAWYVWDWLDKGKRELAGKEGELKASQIEIASAQVNRTLTAACLAYSLRHDGKFPQKLQTLLQKDAAGGPYLAGADALKDPWGQTYQYDPIGPRNNGTKPDIWTTSPPPENRVIGNWR